MAAQKADSSTSKTDKLAGHTIRCALAIGARIMQDTNSDFDLIEEIYELIDDDKEPHPNKWQAENLASLDADIAAGVCWHPGTVQKNPLSKSSTKDERMEAVLREVCSWFVQQDNKFIPTSNKDCRLGTQEIEKLLPQMLAEHFPDNDFVEENAGKLTAAAIFGAGADPRMSFGIYSGKAYPSPGNPSKRLFRDGMWDINTWRIPAYRALPVVHPVTQQECPFEAMLKFAIPDDAQRTMLLDWVAWNLQNESDKPNWAVMLFSETKGTGKSTIAKVLTGLFGLANTAATNGIRPLTQRFSADVLDRKLVVAEEVHISSHSAEGNALKDLITNSVVSVERKYQPIVSIPQTSCFIFMTNHKPLWLEGGERRYYIVDMNHEGHAQGEFNDEFNEIAGRVNELAGNAQFLRDLYERLVTRILSPSFDAKNMRFSENATPIMRELQSTSGNESEQVLMALLNGSCVDLIPNEDFPGLIAHLKLRNANSLRNMLANIGWQPRRVRFGGSQHRVWCHQSLEIENRRVSHARLANRIDPRAETSGFTWFDLEYYVKETWTKFRANRLLRQNDRGFEADAAHTRDNTEGLYGPFASSTSHLRFQARSENELRQPQLHVLGR